MSRPGCDRGCRHRQWGMGVVDHAEQSGAGQAKDNTVLFLPGFLPGAWKLGLSQPLALGQ